MSFYTNMDENIGFSYVFYMKIIKSDNLGRNHVIGNSYDDAYSFLYYILSIYDYAFVYRINNIIL
jgi:hypothetical protein